MKKLLLFFTCILSFLLIGCKTSEVVQEKEIDPLSLLSDGYSIYVSIPEKNSELISHILSSRSFTFSEKASSSVSSRIGKFYSALGTVKDRSLFECALSVSIPKSSFSLFLSSKSGWKKENVSFSGLSFEKFLNENQKIELSFPASNLLVASQNVDPLLEKYASSSFSLDTEWKKWIGQESTDILFYVTRPGQYLRNLIGQAVNTGSEAVYGSFSRLPSSSSNKAAEKESVKYELSLFIRLSDKKSMTLLKSLLSLSFGMTGGTVEETDYLTLHLFGVEVTDSQIESLFTRDPITGKHFRVVDDVIIEESFSK